MKTKEKRVGEIERMVDTALKIEGKEEIRVRNKLYSIKDKTETGRRYIMLRKVEIAEALL